jgi:uncharacterized membrane protein (DUF106 family)
MSLVETILQINPLILIALISLILSLLINVVYKLTTNQELMKKLKDELKIHQDDMKKHRSDPKKMAEAQKKAMEKNMIYMKHSFKPTLYTFIPLILIFSWFNAHLAYLPLQPNETFQVKAYSDYEINLTSVPQLELVGNEKFDKGTIFSLRGDEGSYTLWYDTGGEKRSNDILITTKQAYEKTLVKFKDSKLTSVQVLNKDMKPFGDFSFFGWHPGWIGTYIIFSLIFSMVTRKLMKIY